jgi:hypothetical protein
MLVYKQACSDPREIFAKCFLVFAHKYIFFSIVLFVQEEIYTLLLVFLALQPIVFVFSQPGSGL